ncbi:OmpA family protein [Testudinibacter sp. P80/BLE/0925]|uniref:OmpA family protein n=1 Tax=Testudinibacter sp. TW-1 TaxID=3417757 RepID=UPI003D362702
MKQYLAVFAAAVTLNACSLPQGGIHQPLEKWVNNDAATVSSQNLASNQGLVVFYRQDHIATPAVNIYINGDYQASLLENGFSTIALCADQHFFSASLSRNDETGNRTKGIKFIAPSQDVTYIKVKQVRNGNPIFEFVKPSIATDELAALQRQTQTLSRVKQQSCNSNEYALFATTIDTQIAFPLDKHGYSDLLPAGRSEVQEFVTKIKNVNQQLISKVVVNGHTDPEGSAAYNQRLSEKRADTISNIFRTESADLPIVTIGSGENELVVKDCAIEYRHNKAAKTECNLPNRRVDIVVYGQK